MKKILYYLWKGIFVIISILLLPIVWEYVCYNFKNNGNSLTHICVTSIFMLIIVGIIIAVGYYSNQLIELFNPKNNK